MNWKETLIVLLLAGVAIELFKFFALKPKGQELVLKLVHKLPKPNFNHLRVFIHHVLNYLRPNPQYLTRTTVLLLYSITAVFVVFANNYVSDLFFSKGLHWTSSEYYLGSIFIQTLSIVNDSSRDSPKRTELCFDVIGTNDVLIFDPFKVRRLPEEFTAEKWLQSSSIIVGIPSRNIVIDKMITLPKRYAIRCYLKKSLGKQKRLDIIIAAENDSRHHIDNIRLFANKMAFPHVDEIPYYRRHPKIIAFVLILLLSIFIICTQLLLYKVRLITKKTNSNGDTSERQSA